MPRIARKIANSGIYHVVMRGINHQHIFGDRFDYKFFIYTLRRIAKPERTDEHSCDIYAYALMSNHFHLLIGMSENNNLGDVMMRIVTSYAMHFNHRYGRDGHLFKDRFKSEPCDDEDYFITLLRYIHQNPVKAGMVKRVEDYEFTSWREYISDIPDEQGLCNISYTLGIISKESLIDVVNQPLSEDFRCMEDDIESSKKISDIEITDCLLNQFNISSPIDLQNLDKKQRDEILCTLLAQGAKVRQLQRITGVGKNIISRLSQRAEGL